MTDSTPSDPPRLTETARPAAQARPALFDRAALQRQRARAARDPALFLQEAVADDVEDRLAEVNRSFTDVAVVTPWPDLWARRLPGARIVPDAETLDLEEGAHDLVIHALSLHWAEDPIGQLIQCRRALAPDGLVMATLFGGETLSVLRQSLTAAETAVTGGLSPRVAPMGEIRDLGALLQRAGLAMPVADGTPLDVTYATPFHLMRDLRAMGEANAMAGRLRRPTRRAVLAEAARLYSEAAGDAEGRIKARFEVITLTGWAPSADQPKPLRPGSATRSLEAALREARDESAD
ncbi:methyltransferase domain-containing protein [Limimaricola pyoseonensis]|uniref:Methyltransferase domain-containing protein n=1 Tax=Limimaricola pyoseonensis TaxID=521013 RepID=A0A1G7EIW7_9RHOB|nr:methyltransferase domain-containing protein [Limimaricola pyoseonensis]SDE63346.1 Methyltransferase domain-containing protein [Limimaricola pyoseonensis]